jgi:hypothetical protein
LIIILAEVGDTVPGVWEALIGGVFLASLIYALGSLRWWCAIGIVPVILFFDYVAWSEMQDPFMHRAVLSEWGYGYVALGYGAWNGPALIAAVILRLVHQRRRRLRILSNHCRTCG